MQLGAHVLRHVRADGLAQNGDFVKVPPEVLEWNHRMPLVLAEILESGADIVCMQELNHFGATAEGLPERLQLCRGCLNAEESQVE